MSHKKRRNESLHHRLGYQLRRPPGVILGTQVCVPPSRDPEIAVLTCLMLTFRCLFGAIVSGRIVSLVPIIPSGLEAKDTELNFLFYFI